MLRIVTAIAATAMLSTAALAQTVHEVQMLNKGPDGERNVFEPAVLQIEPGDTVKFIPTDKGHNSQVIEEMMPEGGTEWKSRINKEVEVTFDTEGTFGYQCQPHYATGMVGLILVGDASVNFEEAKAETHRGKAKQRFDEYFAQAEEMMASGS